MNKEERKRYDKTLAKVAGNLGLQGRSRLEDRIVQACVQKVSEICARLGNPRSLSDLLEFVAADLGLRIFEAAESADVQRLLKEIPPSTEPVMARIPAELDDQTDALVVLRTSAKSYEPQYLAVINAMGWHRARRYFSKWHEASHLLVEGRQMTFAFRRTSYSATARTEPIERIVDKVAGALAFYPPIFRPAVQQVLGSGGEITFEAVQRVRDEAIPEASIEATTMACIETTATPMVYLQAAVSHKKTEARMLSEPDLFPDTRVIPEKKLRISKAIPNSAARALGVSFYQFMSVPEGSLVAKAHTDQTAVVGTEDISLWPYERASGYRLHVQAQARSKGVLALLKLARA